MSSGFANPKRIIVFIINFNHDTVSLREGQVLGQIEKIESVMVIETECFAISQEKFDPTIFDINPEISPADRQELVSLFATSTKNLGSTNKVKHSINTQEANPIRQRLWTRYSSAENDFISQQIAEMLEAGVISRTNSPWASNVVLAKKKDGTLRFCTDFRQLNDVTVFDSYPLPRIDDVLDSRSGSSYFSPLDLISGYWQIEMNKEDGSHLKTAFITRDDTFLIIECLLASKMDHRNSRD